MEAIHERATEYATRATWDKLVRKHRRKGCEDLALLARDILRGRDLLDDAAARATGGLLALLGRPPLERVFAQELARRLLPLTFDHQLTAAARGLQIAGIYSCFVGGRDLTECACLQDVTKTEGKARLQELVQNALEDWQELPARMRDGFPEA